MVRVPLALKFIIIFNFLIVLIYCCWFSEVSFAQSRIIFNEIYYDFGKLKTDNLVTHIFEFKNSGNDILTVTEIKSSCGCVVTNLAGRDFQPEEKGEIKVLFKPEYIEGEQEKNIFVYSNDPDFPVIKLSVIAEIKVAAIVKPQILYFSKLDKRKKVTVINKLERDLIITSIDAEKNSIDFKISNADYKMPITIKANEEVDILVSLKNENFKKLSTILIIHTNYIDYPDFYVSIDYKASINDL